MLDALKQLILEPRNTHEEVLVLFHAATCDIVTCGCRETLHVVHNTSIDTPTTSYMLYVVHNTSISTPTTSNKIKYIEIKPFFSSLYNKMFCSVSVFIVEVLALCPEL